MKLGIPGGEAVAAAAAEMMIPLKRIGTPEEAAGAMLMLASPYSAFITGQACPQTHCVKPNLLMPDDLSDEHHPCEIAWGTLSG